MSDSAGKAVFVSYASQDAEAAKRICEAIRGSGVEVWFDQSELVGGDQWDQKIRGQVKACALFVPIISANTQARLEGYFRLEWKLAAQRTHTMADAKPFLLPVVIDATGDAEAHVPEEFRSVQWTRLPAGETPGKFCERVRALLRGEIAAPARARPEPPAGTAAPASVRRMPLWPFALGMAILVGAGIRLATRPNRSPPPPASLVKHPAPATPAAEFPSNPDLKRVHRLIHNVVDGIAEDFALADDLVKPLLATRPNDPEVVTVAAELAQEFVTRGFDSSPARSAEARRLTERAVQLAPENPEALAALGYYLLSTRTQLGRAGKSLRRAIELNPREPRFRCYLYQIIAASGKPAAEIEAAAAQMAALFPDDPMVAYVIASHDTAVSDFAGAEKWLDKTLALAPLPNAITAKARFMLEVHGDIDGMERWLERMPERQRTNARLLNAYAVLAEVTGHTRPARRLLDSIEESWLADGTYIFPKAMLVGDLDKIDGFDDVARLQYEAALKEIRSKLAANPTDLRPVRAELWVQLRLGHRDEARTALRINLQRRPNPYRWSLNLTWWTSALRACLLLDDRAQAMALLREAGAEPNGRLLLRNLFRIDPKMAPFRNDPQITALLAK